MATKLHRRQTVRQATLLQQANQAKPVDECTDPVGRMQWMARLNKAEKVHWKLFPKARMATGTRWQVADEDSESEYGHTVSSFNDASSVASSTFEQPPPPPGLPPELAEPGASREPPPPPTGSPPELAEPGTPRMVHAAPQSFSPVPTLDPEPAPAPESEHKSAPEPAPLPTLEVAFAPAPTPEPVAPDPEPEPVAPDPEPEAEPTSLAQTPAVLQDRRQVRVALPDDEPASPRPDEPTTPPVPPPQPLSPEATPATPPATVASSPQRLLQTSQGDGGEVADDGGAAQAQGGAAQASAGSPRWEDEEEHEHEHDSDEEMWAALRTMQHSWMQPNELCRDYTARIEAAGLPVDYAVFNVLQDPWSTEGMVTIEQRPLPDVELAILCHVGRQLAQFESQAGEPALLNLRLSHVGLDDSQVHLMCGALSEMRALETLWLDGNFITAVGGADLARALPRSNVIGVNLDGNELRAEGAAAVTACCRACPQLCSLALNDNCIGDAGAKSIAANLTALADPRQRLVAVFKKLEPERLFENDVDVLLDKFQGNEARLWELLRERYAGRGGPLLDDGAVKPAALRALELSENNITSAGVKHLVHTCRCNDAIVSLLLSHNQIGDAGASIIAGLFRENCALEDVNLDDNGITDEGFAELLRASKQAPSLVSLSLNGNNFGSVAMAWLVSSSEDWLVDDFELALDEHGDAPASPARKFKINPRMGPLPTSPIQSHNNQAAGFQDQGLYR